MNISNFSLHEHENKIKKCQKDSKCFEATKKDNKLDLLALTFGIILGLCGIVGTFLCIVTDHTGWGTFVLFLTFICFYLAHSSRKALSARPQLENVDPNKLEILKQEFEVLYQKALDGEWEPDYSELSELCKNSSISEIDNSFSHEKFKLLVEKLLIEDGIPETTFKTYKSEEKLNIFFNGVRRFNKQKDDEHKKIISTPVNASLTEESKTYYSDLQKYILLTGKEKRTKILSDSINKVSRKISQIEYGKYCAQQLAVAVRMSADEKKTSNWGITGGIASAIAGPAAGLAAAYGTMSKNAEIERENAKNRAYAHELSRSLYSSSFKMSDDEYALKREKEALEKELERTKSLVTIENIDNNELLKSIKIKSTKINIDKDTNELLIEVEMNSSFIPDEAFIGKMVVDGYIKYDVYKADIFVGKAILLLPVYGINCEGREAVPVNGKCDKYLPETTEYKLKNPCGKLWLVEA